MLFIQLAKSGYFKAQDSRFPFTVEDRTQKTPPEIINLTKKDILSGFVSKFKEINSNVPEIQNMSLGEIASLLGQWKSNSGNLGQQFSEDLAKAFQNRMLTGGYLLKDFDNYIKRKEFTNITSSAQQNIAKAQKALELIKKRLEDYIDILSDSGEEVLLQRCIELKEQAGKPFTGKGVERYNNHFLSSVDQKQIKNKVMTNMKNLEIIIGNLRNLASGGKSGKIETVNKKGEKVIIDTPRGLLSLASSGVFNPVGGEGIHEPIVAHVANVVKYKGYTEVLDPIKKIFGSVSHFYLKGQTDGVGGVLKDLEGTKMEGKQVKPDINLYWDLGSFTVEFPASLKARYGPNSYSRKQGNFQKSAELSGQNISLGELLAMAIESGNAATYEQGWSALLSSTKDRRRTNLHLDGNYHELNDSWNNFRRVAYGLGLFRGLVGTGLKGDFAALLIINNKIYSMYDILNQLGNNKFFNSSKLLSVPSQDNPSIPIKSYFQIYENINADFSETIPKNMTDRKKSQQDMIEKLYQEKYYISFNLRMLNRL